MNRRMSAKDKSKKKIIDYLLFENKLNKHDMTSV